MKVQIDFSVVVEVRPGQYLLDDESANIKQEVKEVLLEDGGLEAWELLQSKVEGENSEPSYKVTVEILDENGVILPTTTPDASL